MGLLGSMSVRFLADTSGLTAGVQVARGALSQVGQGNFAAAAVSGLGMITGAAIGIGVSSVNAAANFEQSMLKVSSYASLSKQQTTDMSNSILDMASKLGQSPKAMADAIYPIVSSGYSASQALDILNLSAKTAAASGANMSSIADMLTTSLKASGAPASQAGHYMDMFNKIVGLGKGQVSDYSAVIGKLTLAAGSAHVPFDQMGAALATLTTHGFPSVAQASTALGNLFTQIGPKVDLVAQHAKKLGIAFDESKFKTLDLSGQLKYLQDVTGGNQGALLKLLGGSTLALKAFDSLSGSSKDLASNMSAMKHSAGATDDAFKTASSGFNASMDRMKGATEALQIKLGTALLPALTKIVDKVAPLVTNFATWIEKNHIVENSISTISNVSKTLVTDIGNLVTGVQNIVKYFQQNQVAGDALAGSLAGIGTILAGMAAGAVVDFLVGLPALIGGFVTWTIAAGAAAVATLAATWPLLLIGAVVALVITGIILAFQHWGDITKWFKTMWADFTGWFQGAMSNTGKFFTNIWDGIKKWFSDTWNNITDKVHQGMDNIGQAIDRAKGFIHDKFVEPFQNAWATISGIFGNIGAGISALASGNIPGALHDFGIPGFASGVRNFGGGLAVVGENGPELVKLPQGSDVYPSGTTPTSGGGMAAQSGDQNIYIELDGNTLAHVVGDRQAKNVRLRMGRRAA